MNRSFFSFFTINFKRHLTSVFFSCRILTVMPKKTGGIGMELEVSKKMRKSCAILGMYAVSFFTGMKIRELQERLPEFVNKIESEDDYMVDAAEENEEAMAFSIEEKKLKDQYHQSGEQYAELFNEFEDFDPEKIKAENWDHLLFDYGDFDISKLNEEKENFLELFDFVTLEQNLADNNGTDEEVIEVIEEKEEIEEEVVLEETEVEEELASEKVTEEEEISSVVKEETTPLESEIVIASDIEISDESMPEEAAFDPWAPIDENTSLLSSMSAPEIPEIVSEDNFEIKQGYHKTYYNKTYNFTEDELRLLGFVVERESKKESYQDALGNVSVILNRLEDPRYPDYLTEVLTAPSQFVVYSDKAYADYVASGKTAPEYVLKAIETATVYGVRTVDYVEWKACNTSDKTQKGERKYQIVVGGDKYHNLARDLYRTHLLEDLIEDPYQEQVEEVASDKAKSYSYHN